MSKRKQRTSARRAARALSQRRRRQDKAEQGLLSPEQLADRERFVAAARRTGPEVTS